MSDGSYTLDGKAIDRDQFYGIACDPARSVAVEACAGSGKTWLLVSRMLRALLAPVLDASNASAVAPLSPHEILAITFTRKAAGEMQQRLDEWLCQFSRDHDDDTLLQELQSRGVDPLMARQRLPQVRQACAAWFTASRPVQVRTFHGWFAALLRSAPLTALQALGLPLESTLLEDSTEAVQQLWPRLYQALDTDRQERADYMSLVAKYGRFSIRQALEAALAKRLDFQLADQQGAVESSVREFGRQFPDFAHVAEPLDDLIGQGATRDLLEHAARALGRSKAAKDRTAAHKLELALSEGSAAGVVGALMSTKNEPLVIGGKLEESRLVATAQRQVQRALQAREQHEAWLYHQRMTRVVRVMFAEFAGLKRERGWVDMPDLEHAARTLLSDPLISGWVQERLDMQVRHLLIDEFQDTSPLQWQALHAWLASYSGAATGAPSVFIVGDPKQSIYRFRGAAPQVFQAAQSFIVHGLGGTLLGCDHTRRNSAAVIDVVNRVMGRAVESGQYQGFRPHSTGSQMVGQALAMPLVERPAKPSRTQAAVGDTGDDPMPVWRDSLLSPRVLPEEELRALECRQVAHWVAGQIAAGTRPGDIMVLSRMRDRLLAMEEQLRELRVACEQPEKLELALACEVQDVLALVDVLASPSHDLSLARVLKSPLFGLADSDLVELALQKRQHSAKVTGNSVRANWYDLVCEPGQPVQALALAGASLKRWKAWLDQLPPHDALTAIFEDGDVWRRFSSAAPAARQPAVLANLRALLSATLDMDGGRYSDPYALVRRLRRGGVKAAAASAPDVVRLLTIHGAKGLEAQTVVILDSDSPPSVRARPGVLLDWPIGQDAPRKLAFLRNELQAPQCCASELAEEQIAREREELNALYVAMTRAKSVLVFSALQGARATSMSWWQRVTSHLTVADSVSQHDPGARQDASPRRVQVRLVAPARRQGAEVLSTVSPNAATKASGATEQATIQARIGSAMHRLLELWPTGQAAPPPHALHRVAHEFQLDDRAVSQALDMARSIVQGQASWAWDGGQIDEAYNEVELVSRGRILRLDRLVRKLPERTWWVLDYKSSASSLDQPARVTQLQAYRDAVTALYRGEQVMAAFLAADGSVEILP